MHMQAFCLKLAQKALNIAGGLVPLACIQKAVILAIPGDPVHFLPHKALAFWHHA